MKKIAVYGSLKKGFYNYSADMGEPVGHSTIEGAMFLNYSYPHLYRPEVSEEDQIREHKVEIYEIDDALYERIEAMERGAGYQVVPVQLYDQTSGAVHEAVVFYTQDDRDYKNNWIEEYSARTVPFALA